MEVKVISGDNPVTVSEVARRVGIENADKCISLDGMSDDEIIEAARMDGANEFYIFHRIIFPMAKNGISSIAIFQFLWTWEDYLWPYLVINTKEKQLLAVGLKMFNGQYSTDYGALFAATAISIIPVLLIYLFFQKQFIAGIAASAVKG